MSFSESQEKMFIELHLEDWVKKSIVSAGLYGRPVYKRDLIKKAQEGGWTKSPHTEEIVKSLIKKYKLRDVYRD